MKITLPLFVMLPRKTMPDKKCIINLNNFPHWHNFTYNEIKKGYKEIMKDRLKGLKFKGKIKIEYTYYKGSKRKSDKANILSIQDKFFCDALTECGCIKDDNDDIIEEIVFKSGGIDKDNPRVEAVITELQ